MKKRFFIACACMLSAALSMAQNADSLQVKQVKHLDFLGIPMELPLQQFSDSLVAKGMERDTVKNGIAIFENFSYAGHDSCRVQLEVNGDVVHSASILLPVAGSWEALEQDYGKIKQDLTATFGRPESVQEMFFATPDTVNLQDNAAKFSEVLAGRSKYHTLFLTDEGRIFVTILKYREKGENLCRVIVKYMDYENFKKQKR